MQSVETHGARTVEGEVAAEEKYRIIAVSAALLVYTSAAVACKILWPWRGPARGLLAECRHRCRRRAPLAEEEAVKRRVAEECTKRRVERAGMLLVLSCVFSAFYCIICVRNAAAGEKQPVLDFRKAVVWNVLMFVRTTVAFFPKRLAPWSVDALYCMNIFIIVWWSWCSGTSTIQIITWRVSRVLIFLYWSLFDLKLWLNACAAFCLILTETAMLARLGAPLELIVPTAVAYSAALPGLFMVNYGLTQSIRYEILAEDSKSELTAIQKLLNSICDVIVQLDGQLRLKQHSPKLAEVLLRPAARSLAGTDLRDCMATDTDRNALSERLRISDEEATNADVFNARLRDSASSIVAMEFFTVGYRGPDGGQHHIVGMREHTDIQPLADRQGQGEPPPPSVQAALPRHVRTEGQVTPRLIGTPRSPEQGDLNAHRSSSAIASEQCGPGKEPSAPGSESGASPRAPSVGVSDLAAAAESSEATPRGHYGHYAVAAAASAVASSETVSEVMVVATTGTSRAAAAEASGTPTAGPSSVPPAAAAVAPPATGSSEAPAAPLPLMETSEKAKIATAGLMLASWSTAQAQGFCCPKHAAVAGLRKVAASLSSDRCEPGFGPTTDWQCRLCGIMADEYKPPRGKRRCLLCSLMQKGRSARSVSGGERRGSFAAL